MLAGGGLLRARHWAGDLGALERVTLRGVAGGTPGLAEISAKGRESSHIRTRHRTLQMASYSRDPETLGARGILPRRPRGPLPSEEPSGRGPPVAAFTRASSTLTSLLPFLHPPVSAWATGGGDPVL